MNTNAVLTVPAVAERAEVEMAIVDKLLDEVVRGAAIGGVELVLLGVTVAQRADAERGREQPALLERLDWHGRAAVAAGMRRWMNECAQRCRERRRHRHAHRR